MITEFTNSLEQLIKTSYYHLPYALKILAIIWAINMLNWYLLSGVLNNLGIYPRRLRSLPGIFFAPILHGNVSHLFYNSIPFVMLSVFILSYGKIYYFVATLDITLLCGIAVWLFGRRAMHIGASGLVMGYWGLLLTNAYHHPTANTLILAIVTLYYFSGLMLNLFPSEIKVSWEAHIFGCLAGICTPSVMVWFSHLHF